MQALNWIENYINQQIIAFKSVDCEKISMAIEMVKRAYKEDRQIFIFGNGGSAANSSHFAVDLGKSASMACMPLMKRPFRVISLTDNVPWITALANDYTYNDVFQFQIQNLARAGDLAIGVSVSGNSPNCKQALRWAKQNGLNTISLVGKNLGGMIEYSDLIIDVQDNHYGRVEDVQMSILHMICYSFIENSQIVE